MLDHVSEEQRTLSDSIAKLPCAIEFPASAGEALEKRTTLTGGDEQRRHPRFPVPAERRMAALQYRQTLPALPRDRQLCTVYTLDRARGGTSFLHAEPLYPGERMELMFVDGQRRTVDVVRCRRWGRRCFEVGTRFVTNAN